MFAQLLDDIHAGGTLEVNALAAKYNTTPQLITAMLGHLERLGVIVTYVDCANGCQTCSLSDGCTHKAAPFLWQSTSRQ